MICGLRSQLAQLVKYLPGENKDMSSMPRTHILKKQGKAVHTCNSRTGEVELDRSLGLDG